MANSPESKVQTSPAGNVSPAGTIDGTAYEVIRSRIQGVAADLRERTGKLDARRQDVFGSLGFKLLQADRITTAHNCIPRDMVQLGRRRFLFGFNVSFGLKKQAELGDVFALYDRDEATGGFKELPLDPLKNPAFLEDFQRLYHIYDRASFSKFSLIERRLYMVFQIGPGEADIAVFKWTFDGEILTYIDSQSANEYRQRGFPPRYAFEWLTPSRQSFRYGAHPHLSIEERVFVECIGGDLTIKVEDNTTTGEGVYSEPVADKHQKVDDAEIAYAVMEPLVLLKIRPYKESSARYFIYNEKLQQASRVDSIGASCALLPEGHGLIFPDGCYLSTGDAKIFEASEHPMVIERVVHSPGGEDSLFVFYNSQAGVYVLMPYRLIDQRIEERIVCHGFSLFDDGHLVVFRAESEPQKHHSIQLRHTPFYQPGNEPPGKREAFLYQVGNKDVVRCLAECNEILNLCSHAQPYAQLYSDLVKRCETVVDAYPWLSSPDGCGIREALQALRESADQAVGEFAKVRRLKQQAAQMLVDVRKRCDERFGLLRRASFNTLDDFVANLSALRHLRGELITLKDARYADIPGIESLEGSVTTQSSELAAQCARFLLEPQALEPHRKHAAAQLAAVDQVSKAADGRKLDQELLASGHNLELLIETVNSLRIDDATQATRIIDGITSVYSVINQARTALKQRLQNLSAAEGSAQFSAQMKLLSQSAASYLDLCDTPAKCDEHLNRLTLQLEDLEGRFADFPEYIGELSEKRGAIVEAFEQRKLALAEQRNKKAGALSGAVERIFKAAQARLASFKDLEEINAYIASDLMVAKARDHISQLSELGQSVKADELEGKLKSIQQDAVRLLKDRQDLYAGGGAVIQLGRHKFNVNTQPLELTIALRNGEPCFHLASTQYFENIKDPVFLESKECWEQELVSETAEVARVEYLAWKFFTSRSSDSVPSTLPELLLEVQKFMESRYGEGYSKGIHDHDAASICYSLRTVHEGLGRARHSPDARAFAVLFWLRFCPVEARSLWAAKLKAAAGHRRLFGQQIEPGASMSGLVALIHAFAEQTQLFPSSLAEPAAAYLSDEIASGDGFSLSQEAARLQKAFRQRLTARGVEAEFGDNRRALSAHPVSEFELVRDWLGGFVKETGQDALYLQEAAAMVFCGDDWVAKTAKVSSSCPVEGLKSIHSRIREGRFEFEYHEFSGRLRRFCEVSVPRFEKYQQTKRELLDGERRRLRLDEFKPKVLSSFVRNALIDEIYLPIVGANLAKQIGAAGETKRTDLMGLLLLISPPGYGKTTLMEYVASRLGIVFVKINGPALGHGVTSLDPAEAPNAAAREEIRKLNLSLEMGDNVMICVDDIQHTNPEFLQKFISLCDGQRKIEGVWKERPRTYDLRGRKVVVVMAGNPYTETGQKFKLPDMLSNRADTYNLGDVLGGSLESFKSSYLENAVTSNPVLAPLTHKSQKDIREFIRAATVGAAAPSNLEASYSSHEVEEIMKVMRHLVVIRDVVFQVNQAYIASAAQSDEFRTEPPFRLQGSYRNMNRLAEKTAPIMNPEEVRTLLLDHYKGESQTLATGAEANFLKFKELLGLLSGEEAQRWEEILKTFRRNQTVRGADGADPASRVVAQLSLLHQGLESIQTAVAKAAARAEEPGRSSSETQPSPLQGLREELIQSLRHLEASSMGVRVEHLSREMKHLYSVLNQLEEAVSQQRDHMKASHELLSSRARQGAVEFELTQEMLSNEQVFLDKIRQVIADAQGTAPSSTPPPTT